MAAVTPREFAIKVVARLRREGHEAYWAGGCVRDELLGLIPQDYDVATSARPEQVQELFPRTLAVGAAFGVIEVLDRHLNVQVATFRSDGAYIDGRRPETVLFSSAEQDAQRRDFTINGMFFDPIDNKLIDFVGGRADLDSRLLRAIGNPLERIREDRLRMLRAVRLAARFGLVIDPTTESAILQMASHVTDGVSPERIAEELRKILKDRNRARGMRLFMDLGLAGAILPELVPMCGLPHGSPDGSEVGLPAPGHPGLAARDLWEHVLHVLDLLGDRPSFPLAFAALLHDVGKPRTVGRTPARYTYYGHEHVGKRMTGEIAHRLRLSNQDRIRGEWLVEKHQILADARRMRMSKLKQLLVHPGIEELFSLHRADAQASSRACDHVDYAERMRTEWEREGVLAPPPLLTGNDLLAMGLAQGPQFKVLLDRVREAQLEQVVQTPEQAATLVGQLIREGKSPASGAPESEPEGDG